MASTRILVCLLVILCSFAALLGQAPETRVDEFIRAEMAKRQIPGVAVAVVQNGTVILAKGYGLSNIELEVPVRPETVFQTASIGKQFTATAVMMLVERGKIGLDDSIGKYILDAPPSWSGITIRHLLSHTSGLRAYPDGFDYRRDYTEDELLKIVEAYPPAFEPGEKWHYSNAGYMVLGVVIRKVTGKPYADFLQENIFKPLGMSTTRLISELAIVPNRAAGYILYDGQLINQPWISTTLNRTADASWYMTVLDLAKWDAALYGESLLKRQSLTQMWTPIKLKDGTTEPYGFGWYLMDQKGHRLIEHEGAWQGFNANIARYVDDKLTVIVLTNLKSARAPMLSHGVAGLYVPSLAPTYYRPIEDKDPKVTALVRDVMKGLALGTADQSRFSDEGKKAFFPDKAKMYESYLKPIGDPVKVLLVERSDTPNGRTYRWEFFYKNVILLVTATLDANGKIISLDSVDNY